MTSDPSFCDPAYPDFERKYKSTPAKHSSQDFSTEVDPTSFGRMGALRGFVMQSLTQFPTPDDPEVLSLDLPDTKLEQAFRKHHLVPVTSAKKSYLNLIEDASQFSDGILPTTPANASYVKPSEPKKPSVAKWMVYGALAYWILKK